MLYVLKNEFDKAITFHDSIKSRVPFNWLEGPYGLALYGRGDLGKARDVLQSFAR
jgi:hypothetical protein